MYISLIDCVIYVWQSSKSVRRHEEEEIIQGKAESGNNDHSRSGRKEGRKGGRKWRRKYFTSRQVPRVTQAERSWIPLSLWNVNWLKLRSHWLAAFALSTQTLMTICCCLLMSAPPDGKSELILEYSHLQLCDWTLKLVLGVLHV